MIYIKVVIFIAMMYLLNKINLSYKKKILLLTMGGFVFGYVSSFF